MTVRVDRISTEKHKITWTDYVNCRHHYLTIVCFVQSYHISTLSRHNSIFIDFMEFSVRMGILHVLPAATNLRINVHPALGLLAIIVVEPLRRFLNRLNYRANNHSMDARRWLVMVMKVSMRRHAYMPLVYAPFLIATLQPHLSSYHYISAVNTKTLLPTSSSVPASPFA